MDKSHGHSIGGLLLSKGEITQVNHEFTLWVLFPDHFFFNVSLSEPPNVIEALGKCLESASNIIC